MSKIEAKMLKTSEHLDYQSLFEITEKLCDVLRETKYITLTQIKYIFKFFNKFFNHF